MTPERKAPACVASSSMKSHKICVQGWLEIEMFAMQVKKYVIALFLAIGANAYTFNLRQNLIENNNRELDEEYECGEDSRLPPSGRSYEVKVGYELQEEGVKCPYNHVDRLIKHESKTKDECFDECLQTDGCRFFSWGEEEAGQYKDNCMLCTSADNAQEHTGFNLWEMVEETNFSGYEEWADGVKCPWDHIDRLEKHFDTTKDECFQECLQTYGCRFFSWGEEEAGQYKDNCMLCTSAENAQEHTGFKLWEMV